MGTTIEIATLAHDAHFTAYCAEPQDTPKAAVVVVQEVFGVNRGIRARCDALAQDGYLAIAPDLFWRSEPNVELDPDVPGEFEKAIGLMRRTDIDTAVADIEATIRAARSRLGDAKGRIGVMGFCFGGLLAYLAATRTDADAAIGYYGSGIDNFLRESRAIGKPLLLHFAEQDKFIPAETIAKIREAVEGNPHVEIAEYAGVDHGFATSFGTRRVEAAAQEADARSAAFLARHLA